MKGKRIFLACRGINFTAYVGLALLLIVDRACSFHAPGFSRLDASVVTDGERAKRNYIRNLVVGERSTMLRGGLTSSSTKSSTSLHASIWPKSWPISDPKGVAPDFPLTFTRVCVTILSTLCTLYAQHVGHSNVMASAAITLVFSMLFDKRLGQAAFCGSFAGMSSTMIVSNPTWAFVLAILTSACFEILIHSTNMFLGIGGRLGATAFIATLIVASLQKIKTGVSAISFETMTSAPIIRMMFWHAIGSASTITLREVSDDSAASDPVRASAVIGLLAALVLHDKMAALGVYGGSFVGMSLPSRLMYGILPGKKKEGLSAPPSSVIKLLLSFSLAGGIAGLIHGLANEVGLWSGAWGGKAGLYSFLGCLIYRCIQKVYAII